MSTFREKNGCVFQPIHDTIHAEQPAVSPPSNRTLWSEGRQEKTQHLLCAASALCYCGEGDQLWGEVDWTLCSRYCRHAHSLCHCMSRFIYIARMQSLAGVTVGPVCCPDSDSTHDHQVLKKKKLSMNLARIEC